MLSFRIIWVVAFLSILCVLPFKAQAEIIFDAKVNNKNVKFLFDTGSETTLLFNKTVARLKLDVLKKKSSTPADPGKIRVDLTEEYDFQFGPFQTKNSFYVYTPPGWVDAGVDGVLAWSTVRESIIHFSMEESRAEVLDTLPADIDSWSKWTIGPNKQLTMQVENQNGSQRTIMIDTGSPYGIQLNKIRWTDWRNLNSNSPATLTAFFTPASGLVVREECWANRIDIDSFEATIGAFALNRLDVIIDGPSNVLYLKPSNLSTSQYAYNRLGAVFVPESMNSEHLYAHVAEGSPASIAGLRNRDILTKINDLDVTKWRTDPKILPLSRFWSAPAGTRLELTYNRNGGVNRATVELGEIFSP